MLAPNTALYNRNQNNSESKRWHKVPKKHLKKPSKLDMHSSQNEEEICEIGWDSPKPLSGRHTETTVADIVAQLSASVAMPVFSPPLQLHYISPQTKVELKTTPLKAPLCGVRRQSRTKQFCSNQAIIQKVMAVINEYKPQGENQRGATDDDPLNVQSDFGGKPAMRDQSSGVMPVNQSSEELWSDEDGSFINATQAFLDTVITSTPNLRPRNSRLTFRLDQSSSKLTHQKITTTKESRQSSSRSVDVSPLLKVASEKQVSSTKEHLSEDAVKRLESDEILASQLAFLTDMDLSKPNCNDHAVNNKHESFTDNDTLESAELAAAVEEVESEYLASQRILVSAQPGKTSAAQKLPSVPVLRKNGATASLPTVPVPSKTCATRSVTSSISMPGKTINSAPIYSMSSDVRKNLVNGTRCTTTVKQATTASSSSHGKKMCSMEEIERKRQEALQKRRSKALMNSNR